MLEKSADYALIMHHAVRHVGLKLEGAAPAALSFSELTKDYSHPNPTDLSRVKRHEGADSDQAALAWVIRRAVSMLDGLIVEGDMVSFAPGNGFDDLTWYRGKLERPTPDANPILRDAFSPLNGQFSTNVRIELGDLTELRESMKSWGWLPEFPALVDERGVVLVGHRRLKVADELSITPVTKTLTFGNGDYADAQRFKYAIASNLGSKSLSPNDRKRLAAYLYSEQEWTQGRIAEALNVSQQVVSKDLKELPQRGNSKRGRPRKAETKTDPVKAAAEKRSVTHEQEEAIAALMDQGLTNRKIQEQLGLSESVVKFAYNRNLGRLEERQKIEQEKQQAVVEEHFCTCPICGNRHHG